MSGPSARRGKTSHAQKAVALAAAIEARRIEFAGAIAASSAAASRLSAQPPSMFLGDVNKVPGVADVDWDASPLQLLKRRGSSVTEEQAGTAATWGALTTTGRSRPGTSASLSLPVARANHAIWSRMHSGSSGTVRRALAQFGNQRIGMTPYEEVSSIQARDDDGSDSPLHGHTFALTASSGGATLARRALPLRAAATPELTLAKASSLSPQAGGIRDLPRRLSTPLPRVATLITHGDRPASQNSNRRMSRRPTSVGGGGAGAAPSTDDLALVKAIVKGTDGADPLPVREALGDRPLMARVDFLRRFDDQRNQFFSEVDDMIAEKEQLRRERRGHRRRKSTSPASGRPVSSDGSAYSDDEGNVAGHTPSGGAETTDDAESVADGDIVRRNVLAIHRWERPRRRVDRVEYFQHIHAVEEAAKERHRHRLDEKEHRWRRMIEAEDTRMNGIAAKGLVHRHQGGRRAEERAALFRAILTALVIVPRAAQATLISGRKSKLTLHGRRGSAVLKLFSESIFAIMFLQRWWRSNRSNLRVIRVRRSSALLTTWFRSMNLIKVKFALTLRIMRNHVVKLQRHFRSVRMMRRLRRLGAELTFNTVLERELGNIDKQVAKLFKERGVLDAKLAAAIRSRRHVFEQMLKDNQKLLSETVHRKTLLTSLLPKSKSILLENLITEREERHLAQLDEYYAKITVRRKIIADAVRRLEAQSALASALAEGGIGAAVSKAEAIRNIEKNAPRVDRPSACLCVSEAETKAMILGAGIELGDKDYRLLTSRAN